MRLSTHTRPNFTAHNIELPDGTQTTPGKPLIAADPVSESYLRTLRLFARPLQESPTLAALKVATQSTSPAPATRCSGLKERSTTSLPANGWPIESSCPNLRFVLDDVRNIRQHGMFDAVLCAGLLYHIDNPVSFLHELSDVTRK